jgi:hypothetical protein
MTDKEFTSYFQAADKSSIKAQSYYINIVRIDLVAMIIASAISIYNYTDANSKFYVYSISFVLLLLSLILTVILKSKKYEDTWYQSRALAESAKTLTWRFVTCSEYFEENIEEIIVKERFISRIKQIYNEYNELSKTLDPTILTLPIINSKMLELRKLDINSRKEYYIKNRVTSQKNWYSKKASFNYLRYNLWFSIIIACQAIALISVVFLIKYPTNNINLMGLFTTIASSAISWLQLKQHQNLKQAYTIAAQELNIIETLSDKVITSEDLSKFVLDSENAISREHTLWMAQKRK